MSLKNPNTLRKCLKNLQPEMLELQFLKILIFWELFKRYKIEKNFRNFSYLFFPVFIIMVAPLSSVNKEILKEGKVELTRLLLL